MSLQNKAEEGTRETFIFGGYAGLAGSMNEALSWSGWALFSHLKDFFGAMCEQ